MKLVLSIFVIITMLLCQGNVWAQPGQQHPTGAFITIGLNNGDHSICGGIPYFAFDYGYFSTSNNVIHEWYVNDVRMDSIMITSDIRSNRRFIVDSLKAGDSIYCIMTFAWGYNFEKIKSNTIVMTDGSMEPPEVHIAVASTTVCQGSKITFDPVLGPYNRSIRYTWTVDGIEV